jgi:hypothetical protein
MMFRRLSLLFGVGSLVVVSLGLNPAARAAEGKAACNSGAACLWREPNFQGQMDPVSTERCNDYAIRSAFNNGKDILYLYGESGCKYGKEVATLRSGEERGDITAASAELVRSPY